MTIRWYISNSCTNTNKTKAITNKWKKKQQKTQTNNNNKNKTPWKIAKKSCSIQLQTNNMSTNDLENLSRTDKKFITNLKAIDSSEEQT